MPLVRQRQRRRRRVVAAPPDLHLRLAELRRHLRLVQPLQRTVVALVELPGLHHRFIHISSRDAQGPEEISFAAFVHAQPRQQQFRIQNRFITKPRLLQNARFQHELDKILRALALHHQLAAFVKHDIDFLLLRNEPRVRRLAKFIAVFAQIALQSPRLRLGQRAGV